MTTNQGPRPEAGRSEPGYRGALPTREDRLARSWIIAVIAIFVLVFVLAVLGVPSRFIPDPTAVPLPSNPPSGSVEPSASGSESEFVSPSASASSSASPEASPSGE
jgi:cytoskeletal protein RodZ